MKDLESVLKKIKRARLEKGYSQDYVEEQLDISQIAYHKIENGKTELKVKTLFALACILEVEDYYLLG